MGKRLGISLKKVDKQAHKNMILLMWNENLCSYISFLFVMFIQKHAHKFYNSCFCFILFCLQLSEVGTIQISLNWWMDKPTVTHPMQWNIAKE